MVVQEFEVELELVEVHMVEGQVVEVFGVEEVALLEELISDILGARAVL